MKFIATDRHRLASREATVDNDHAASVYLISLFQAKRLNELSKILPDQNTLIDIVVADNQVLFKIGQFCSILVFWMEPTRILLSLFRKPFKQNWSVPTKEFLDAIDRAYLISREDKTNIVKMIMLEDDRRLKFLKLYPSLEK